MKYFSTLLLAFACTIGVAFASSPRIPLIEEGTNASCGPCANANPSFQQWIRTNFSYVIPLVYHPNFPGSTDPMYLAAPEMNYGRLITYYNVSGVPSSFFNGKTEIYPSSTTELTDSLKSIKGTTSPYTIVPTLSFDGTAYTVSVNVTSDQAISDTNIKLRIALVQNHIHDENAGTNGETDFYWIARKMFPDYVGTTLTQAAGETKTYSFTCENSIVWDQSQMYLVAFMQDDSTKEVLQSATNYKSLSTSISIADNYKLIDKNSTFTTTVTTKNPNSIKTKFDLTATINAVNKTTPWNLTLVPSSIELEPNASGTAQLTVTTNDTAYFASIDVQAVPESVAGYVSNSAEVYSYLLSSFAKDVYLYGLSDNENANILTALNSKFKNDIVYMPITSEYVYSNVDFSKFKKVILPFGAQTSYILAGDISDYGDWVGRVYNIINQITSSNTSLFMMSPLGAYLTTQVKYQTALDFYKNTLQLTASSYSERFNSSNGSITGLKTFPIAGVTGDEIGGGISYTGNSGYNSSTWPYYILYTDLLTPTTGSTAKQCFYYDGTTSNGAGYYKKYNNSKIAYLSFDFGGIATSATRVNIFNNIMTWLEPDAAKAPQIAIANDTLNFGKVKVGESKTLPVIISNKGNLNLVLSSASDYSGDPDASFSLNGLTNDITIKPNGVDTVYATFTPQSATTNYNSTILYMNSNDNSNSSYAIYIKAQGSATEVTDPQITLNQSSINFGTVAPGKDSTVDFIISNTGKADLKVSAATINTTDFQVVDFPANGLTISKNSTGTIKVKFVPTETGDYSAKLTLATNDPDANYVKVPLSGTSENPSSVIFNLNTNNFVTLNVTPNPVNDNSIISYTINSDNQEYVTLSIIDISGKTVADLFSGYANPGLNTLNLKASNIPSGKYFLIANVHNTAVQFPIVISK